VSRKSRGALPPKSTPEKELKSCLFLHCVEAGGRARNGGSCTPHLITQGVKLPVAALALALSRDVGASHCSYNFPSRGILRFRGNNVAKMPVARLALLCLAACCVPQRAGAFASVFALRTPVLPTLAGRTHVQLAMSRQQAAPGSPAIVILPGFGNAAVHTCVYVCLIYIPISINISMNISIYMYAQKCTFIHINICVCIYIYVYICI